LGIARGTTTTQTVAIVELEDGGLGEAAPVKYHDQTAEGEAAAIESMMRDVPDEPWDLEGILTWLRHRYPDHSAALCAVDLALHDWIARRLGVPLHRFFGCARPDTKQTSFTIGIDTEEVMLRKVDKAAEHPILKIKLGRDVEHDLRVMKAIRKAVPDKVLRVDANAGWTLDQARRCIPILADLGVEYVEQPLPIGAHDELAVLKRESSLPIFVDEDVFTTHDVVKLAGKCDGVNLKLMKCGGLLEARKMIHVARALGLQLMIGCMIETSLAITAAAQVAALIDHLDLDGNLLIRDDPYQGVTLKGPEKFLHLPEDRPGIGVAPVQ
jgi:L-alanine-DL-glutamate epimerase-like enolase superfamily enzyme